VAILTGEEKVLAAIERLCLVHQVVCELGPADPSARAEAAFRRAFPRWK